MGQRYAGGGNAEHLYGQGLTQRELQVLRLLANGTGTRQGAKALGISPNTLRTHVQNLLQKLGVHSRLEAVLEGVALGLVSIEREESAT